MVAKVVLVVFLLSGALHVAIALILIARLPGANRMRDLEGWSKGLAQPRNMRLLIVVLINSLVLFSAFGVLALSDEVQ
ncbi:MAG TPA: hypothetical protein PLL33_07865 [Paracoccus sp. (in: a-proteobacteria)]|nr:hypothetical protein [Paracoccus sp. (in: a-proteobacteria)]